MDGKWNEKNGRINRIWMENEMKKIGEWMEINGKWKENKWENEWKWMKNEMKKDGRMNGNK